MEELKLTNIRRCPTFLFHCKAEGYCISYVNICDGSKDCFDGSDEINCDYMYFECSNGQKIHVQFTCDNIFHCEDKSDEIPCHMNKKQIGIKESLVFMHIFLKTKNIY